jgi:hypothetical protein
VQTLNAELRQASRVLGFDFIDLLTPFRASDTIKTTASLQEGDTYVDAYGVGQSTQFAVGTYVPASFVTPANAATYISGDNVHPTLLGAQSLGRFILAKLLAP